MYLYHITKKKYLQKILTEGLKINSGKTGFCTKDVHSWYKIKYGIQPIFLTNDFEFITKNMLTYDWIKKHEAIVLKVNVEINDINSNIYYFYSNGNKSIPKEYRYFLNIEPKYIQLY